jgi:multidrug efflux pump subunit AcrB
MNRFNLTEWALEHKSLVYFFIILIFIAGAYSYISLGRMEFPDSAIREMVVSVAWPGASAQQVEQQVTDKIEEQLQDTPGLDYLESYSQPGQSVIFVNLKVDVKASNLQPTWFKVRNMVNDMADTLPAGVQGPYFDDDFADVYGSLYAVTSDGFSYEQMRAQAEQIRRILVSVPDVSKVELLGVQPEQITVQIASSKLSQLGITASAITGALQAQNAMTPSGMIETSSDNLYLRVSGLFNDVESIRNLPISGTSGAFRLGDIASVEQGYADPPEPKMYFNGKPAIGIAVSMDKGGNILALGNNLNATIAQIKKDLPLGLEINQVANQPKVVGDAINQFVATLLIAIAVVLLVCFLTLGLRSGAVVAICIPLVICGVLLGMKTTGIDLHRVSLGALIIALGLLVDDAIIVVEMMKVKLDQGWDRNRAACHAYASTAGPRLTGALVTCAGFIPLGLSKGFAGEMLGSMLWVVAMALVLSWVVAGTVAPLLGYSIIRIKPPAADTKVDIYDTKFYRLFKQILAWCLNHRRLVLVVTVLAFAGSVFLTRFVKQEFFPPPSRTELIVDLRLPEGASIQATNAVANEFAKCLQGNPDIANYSYYVGEGAPRFVLMFSPAPSDTNYAQFVIVARDIAARQRLQQKVDGLLAGQFASVSGLNRGLTLGPMYDYPVMLRVSGYDIDKVRQIAGQVQAVMAAQTYLRDANLNWNEKSPIVNLEIDQDRARMLGISSQELASELQAQLSGAPVTEYLENDRTINVVFQIAAQDRADLSGIKNLTVPAGNGQLVPVDQVATISYGAEEGLIWRYNLKPTITVQANTDPGITDIDATNRVYSSLTAIRKGLPPGYSIDIGGSTELFNEAVGWLTQMVPLMAVVIVVLLMLQLERMPKMILTLLTAPLGMIGVVPTLLLTNQSLYFVVYCGMLALAGIIMRNSVILINQIDQQLKAGESAWNAIINATVLRFRPIMLTAAAAILGMMPLVTDTLWGPMAIAIAGGLLVATVLTLLVLPAMYAAWYKVGPDSEAIDNTIGA